MQVDEDLLRLLLPYMLDGMGADADEAPVLSEYKAATHMILVQLLSKATLAQDFLDGRTRLSYLRLHSL